MAGGPPGKSYDGPPMGMHPEPSPGDVPPGVPEPKKGEAPQPVQRPS